MRQMKYVIVLVYIQHIAKAWTSDRVLLLGDMHLERCKRYVSIFLEKLNMRILRIARFGEKFPCLFVFPGLLAIGNSSHRNRAPFFMTRGQ